MQTNDAKQYIKWAREVLQIEADGLKEISDGLNGRFTYFDIAVRFASLTATETLDRQAVNHLAEGRPSIAVLRALYHPVDTGALLQCAD